MRPIQKPLAALFALGSAGMALLWRSPQARAGLRRFLDTARVQVRDSALPARLDQLRARAFYGTASQAPRPGDTPGVLDLDGDNLTITQRVRSNLGHEFALAGHHININTQARGTVYLRGTVATEEQRRIAETVARNTEGVSLVVNELQLERAANR
jgi:hypothetical protein